MKTLLLVLLLGVTSFSSHAAETTLFFGGWSHHTNRETPSGKPWNESHEVVGLGRNKWSIMYFKNSWGERSVGIGRDFLIIDNQHCDIGLYAGAWSGYSAVVGKIDVLPLITPQVTCTYADKWQAIFLVNPLVNVVFLGRKF